MACGCKNKNNQAAPTTATNINTKISLKNVQPNKEITLTEVQQKEINEIVDKINKINS
jgi:hypothetical protein